MGRSVRNWARVAMIVFLLVTISSIEYAWPQEPYPNKPIKMVHWATAGALDTMTRTLCSVAEKELGQPLVVESKPGGSGAVAFSFIFQSKPDGYNLGATTTSAYTNLPHMQKPPFNVLTDSTDIMAYCRYAQVLCVGAGTPWKTYEELLDWVRKNPGKFKYSVSGVGVAMHICMEQIAMQEGIKWTAVPFRGGGGEAVLAALGGHTEGVTQSPLETGAHIKVGKLRPLLVLTDARVAAFPEVPTILEKGYKFTATTYMSVYGPKGLPESIRQKLEDAFKKAVKDPSYVETAKKFQLDAVFMDGKEYTAYWKSKYEEMGTVIKALGLEAK